MPDFCGFFAQARQPWEEQALTLQQTASPFWPSMAGGQGQQNRTTDAEADSPRHLMEVLGSLKLFACLCLGSFQYEPVCDRAGGCLRLPLGRHPVTLYLQ